MSAVQGWLEIALGELDRTAPEPLHRQLYDILRRYIESGRLPAGSRLPSTRALHADLRVSRNTVLQAVGQLTEEGYLHGRQGSGTYVAAHLPDLPVATPAATGAAAVAGESLQLSARGQRLVEAMRDDPASLPPVRPFTLEPPVDAHLTRLWSQISATLDSEPAHRAADADPRGSRRLREAISRQLSATRGIVCTPDQVLITSSSRATLDLVVRLLTDPGDTALVEDPCYLTARAVLAAADVTLQPVAVDDAGLTVGAVPIGLPRPRLVYVTPSHQYPLGVTMTMPRRLELLEWATRNDAWIVEDDFDSHYRYSGTPLVALQGLDRASRVVYLGTFSHLLYPVTRLSYLVVPQQLVEAFMNLLVLDHRPVRREQEILATFINDGHLARHTRRVRRLYQLRQDAILQIAEDEWDFCRVSPSSAGTHVIAWLENGMCDADVARDAAAVGVSVRRLSIHYAERSREGLLLGYAGHTADEMRTAARSLARNVAGSEVASGTCAGH